ncbi:MAG TPA: hypothetical protein DEP28_00135 [Bacteroidetes bacterium]|nr:hypothetical protein [Bacteroidota bacterium]HRE40615.1 hypothetical protein [Ignavibacteria bacterium]HRI46915.1 hypothetical protein [Ignavibacteriaceae bacterium]
MERTERNPIYSVELEKEFKISGAILRNIIRGFRRDGIPVANCHTGYYYAKSFKEMESTITDLEKRAFSMLETVSKLKKNFEKSQLELF